MKNNEEQPLKLEIDQMRLDEEWVNQPREFHVWANRAANAQAKVDECKSKLDVTKAELDRAIRDRPQDFDLPKLSEVIVANTVLTQPDCKIAVKELNRARHRLLIAQAAVNALEHRKRALSLLVELWIRDYYSDVRMRPQSEGAEEFEREAKKGRRQRRLREREEDDE